MGIMRLPTGPEVFALWNVIVSVTAIAAAWLAPMALWLQILITVVAGGAGILWFAIAHYVITTDT